MCVEKRKGVWNEVKTGVVENGWANHCLCVELLFLPLLHTIGMKEGSRDNNFQRVEKVSWLSRLVGWSQCVVGRKCEYATGNSGKHN